jgi:hypothetical protein
MIDGLKLTFSGSELRRLLEARINRHQQHSDGWTQEQTRPPDDATEDAPLLPDEMCANEAERDAWRAKVLQFIRDHIDPAETYRLDAADLEFGELLPARPEWLVQDDYEQQSRVGFALERMTKAIDGLGDASRQLFYRDKRQETSQSAPSVIEETDEFRTTRIDTGDEGPEIILIERK